MNKKYLWIFSLIFGLIFAVSVQAAAIKVTPSEIKIEVAKGESIKREIVVENPDQNVALYEVYSDNFSSWVNLAPSSFILESKEIKNIELKIQGKEEGIFLTTISVVVRPLSDSGFKINSGVKIPLEIIVSQEHRKISMASISLFLQGQFSARYFAFIVIFVLLIYLIIILLKKKKHLENPKNNYRGHI